LKNPRAQPHPPRPNVNRSRRLRKKLRIGEFQQQGFGLSFRFKAGLSESEQLDILDAFISQAIEIRGLAFGGGENGYVTRAGRASTTEDDRQAVGAWLLACSSIEQVSIHPNTDAWYGWPAHDD
jgi:uncharacterized protein YggL (DUF469 family)